MATPERTARLKAIFQSPRTTLMPFGVPPMHAQMAEREGVSRRLKSPESGTTAGTKLVSDEEAIRQLQAACDAREKLDPDFVIVARTDGYGASGASVEKAICRTCLYQEKTSIDVIFFKGLYIWEQVRRALADTPSPAYVLPHPTIGPRPSSDELSAEPDYGHYVPLTA
ncbi:hypothetical protein BDW68DRAFT_179449 [Aspergillus falconensis]